MTFAKSCFSFNTNVIGFYGQSRFLAVRVLLQKCFSVGSKIVIVTSLRCHFELSAQLLVYNWEFSLHTFWISLNAAWKTSLGTGKIISIGFESCFIFVI